MTTIAPGRASFQQRHFAASVATLIHPRSNPRLGPTSPLCAFYGKVVKFLAVQPYDGGYISFACRWVPYGAAEQPLRTLF